MTAKLSYPGVPSAAFEAMWEQVPALKPDQRPLREIPSLELFEAFTKAAVHTATCDSPVCRLETSIMMVELMARLRLAEKPARVDPPQTPKPRFLIGDEPCRN